MMNEVAFKVNPGCEFYDNYFLAQEEKEKFRTKAKAFFDRHGIECTHYKQTPRLIVQFTPEMKRKFSSQLKKTEEYGMSHFKLKSPIQKAWGKEVVEQINFDLINTQQLWFLSYIFSGAYSLWAYNGQLYGYLGSKDSQKILLKDYMIEIKMSEYYSVIEKAEEEDKNG